MHCDLLIRHCAILADARELREDQAVAVHDGKIAAIEPEDQGLVL
jgi:predicted amidohydrolase